MIQQQPVKNTCTYTYYLTKQKIDFWHESSNYYIFDFMFYFNVLFVLDTFTLTVQSCLQSYVFFCLIYTRISSSIYAIV